MCGYESTRPCPSCESLKAEIERIGKLENEAVFKFAECKAENEKLKEEWGQAKVRENELECKLVSKEAENEKLKKIQSDLMQVNALRVKDLERKDKIIKDCFWYVNEIIEAEESSDEKPKKVMLDLRDKIKKELND